MVENAVAGIEGFVVMQKKELADALSGIEMSNLYEVLDTDGNPLFRAYEKKGSFITRQALRSARPFEIQVTDPANRHVLSVKRPFRWFLPEAEISDGSGRLLGTVRTELTFITRRRLVVTDGIGRELFAILGTLLKPWTFRIVENGREEGTIMKRWSGLMKEAFTTADNFGTGFPAGWDTTKKLLVLGAVFLLDFMYFERSPSK